jgi:hypothetical protein
MVGKPTGRNEGFRVIESHGIPHVYRRCGINMSLTPRPFQCKVCHTKRSATAPPDAPNSSSRQGLALGHHVLDDSADTAKCRAASAAADDTAQQCINSTAGNSFCRFSATCRVNAHRTKDRACAQAAKCSPLSRRGAASGPSDVPNREPPRLRVCLVFACLWRSRS